jgi:TfdA family taurine catabolism dioxygenase TauD
VALQASDPDAFEALFLPDAITALRPRGKGAIRVTAPVFFLGRYRSPQIFFRISSGEYVITWRDHPALHRARKVLENLSAPFAPGSQFVHLMRPGDTVIIDNRHVVHGRTAFIDPPGGNGRVLARKWYVPTRSDASYRHVPGVEVHQEWGAIFPRQFSNGAIEGEWHYDSQLQRNVQL